MLARNMAQSANGTDKLAELYQRRIRVKIACILWKIALRSMQQHIHYAGIGSNDFRQIVLLCRLCIFFLLPSFDPEQDREREAEV